jgi:hypothetical protein
VILDLETCDFRLVDNYPIFSFLGFKISKGASGGESTRENSQGPRYSIVEAIRHFSDGCGLVDFAPCFKDTLLLLLIGWFMIFGDLIALVELITDQYSSGIS